MTENIGDLQLVPQERIIGRILVIRGQKVMLDADLADLYGVETGILNRAVTRNASRFPSDFVFQLTDEEYGQLREYSISIGRGGRRYLPRAFTEQGVAMLSSVLRSQQAVQVNILIMRAFVKMREMLASHKDLARQLDALEKKYDKQFRVVFEAIRQLMEPPATTKKEFGFQTTKKQSPEQRRTKEKGR